MRCTLIVKSVLTFATCKHELYSHIVKSVLTVATYLNCTLLEVYWLLPLANMSCIHILKSVLTVATYKYKLYTVKSRL